MLRCLHFTEQANCEKNLQEKAEWDDWTNSQDYGYVGAYCKEGDAWRDAKRPICFLYLASVSGLWAELEEKGVALQVLDQNIETNDAKQSTVVVLSFGSEKYMHAECRIDGMKKKAAGAIWPKGDSLRNKKSFNIGVRTEC